MDPKGKLQSPSVSTMTPNSTLCFVETSSAGTPRYLPVFSYHMRTRSLGEIVALLLCDALAALGISRTAFESTNYTLDSQFGL